MNTAQSNISTIATNVTAEFTFAIKLIIIS